MDRQASLLRPILEANLPDLLSWRSRIIPDPAVQAYAEIMTCFWKNESVELASLVHYLSLDEHPELYWLGNLRSRLLAQTLTDAFLYRFLENIPDNSIWTGEMKFVAGLAAEKLGQPVLASELFERASKALADLGATKKALRAGEHKTRLSLPIEEKFEHAKAPDQTAKLSKLEVNFIRLLKERPITKFEAIEKLFGRQQDYTFFERRFDTMLQSLQRKCPRSISFRERRYFAS